MMLDGKHRSSYTGGMNKLPVIKRVMILSMLVEGMSMRAISRTVGVSINTVSKLLVEAGEACAAYHDETVRDVRAEQVQCDEIWSFCYAKEKNVASAKSAPDGAGDVWTWTAIDRDSKMILAFEVGDRSAYTARDICSIWPTVWRTGSSSPRTGTAPTSRPWAMPSAATWTSPSW